MSISKHYIPRALLLVLAGGIALLALFALRLLGTESVRAAGPICRVGTGAQADYVTIQAAVNDTSCKTIIVSAGVYHEDVAITRDLAVRGSGANSSIVIGSTYGRVFNLGCGGGPAASVTISDLTIRDAGRGICNGGTLNLSNSIITNNVLGGIENQNTAHITNTLILSNTANPEMFIDGSGGGILNSGVLTLRDSKVLSNTATADGGGIYSMGKLTVENSSISGNKSARNGGGIYATGSFGVELQVVNSTISDNRANGGGGIYAETLGSGSAFPIGLTNVTIGGNTAQDGGGILKGTDDPLRGNITINLLNVTLAHNTASTASGTAGIKNNCCAQTIFQNTIVADNGATNCSSGGTLVSNGYNFDSGNSCGFTKPTDKHGVNPKLAPLALNGGPTATYALLRGSPAIDVVDDVTCPATDQRGQPRSIDGNNDGIAVCDSGAYEATAEKLVFMPLVRR